MFKNKFVFLRMSAPLSALTLGALLLGPRALGQPVEHTLFATSDNCIACHSNIHAANGENASIGYQWRATMMANSSRDPYWHAAIRRETMDHPQLREEIEDICSTCHMPMARYQAHAEGRRGEVLRYLEALRGGAAAQPVADPGLTLAADGVSCTTCHQIRPDNFGEEDSFDGGFIIDLTTPAEQRPLYGRFEVDAGHTTIMRSATGFTPTQSEHLRQSELCASCHTLFTHAVDDQGNPAGVLPEQVPYHEWLHSDYVETNSCQSCHMPRVAVDAPITSVLGQPRADVSHHTFVGGNAFMLNILNTYRDELAVTALPGELAEAVRHTEQFLSTQSATLQIANVQAEGARLLFDVAVDSLSGHKLPTAYPSRRVWLHVTVRDANGTILFESGAPQPDGSIAGNDNDARAAAFEPHYTRITNPDQVQIYESIMGDHSGAVTTGLLFGARYLKDNRILPKGFDKTNAPEDVAVIGDAVNDENFVGGSDIVTFDLDLGEEAGSVTIAAELLYQSIGYRWAENLRGYDAPEPQRFVRYFEASAATSTKHLADVTQTID